MKRLKKALSLGIVLAMAVSLLSVCASAEDDPAAKLAATNQQIKTLEGEISQLNAQISQYTGQARVLMGLVLSTDPYLVAGGGLGMGSFTDALTGREQAKQFQILDPEHGSYDSKTGFYYGTHRFVERTYAPVSNEITDVYGPLADEYYPLDQQLETKQATLDQLKEQHTQIQNQMFADKQLYIDRLWKYNTNSDTDIILQIGNPYILAYGKSIMIEDGNLNANPTAVNGSTLVPIRAIMDAVGGGTLWFADTPEQVGLYLAPTDISLTLNDTTAYIDGEPVTMPVAPQIIGGKTMLPLRFVSETLGMKVEWIAEDSIIRIVYSNNKADHTDRFIKDLGDGSKQFTDTTMNAHFSIPSDCEIKVDPTNYNNPDYITITSPNAKGHIKMHLTSSGPNRNNVQILEEASNQGPDSNKPIEYIHEAKPTHRTYYLENPSGGLWVRLEVIPDSDTKIADISAPPETFDQMYRELEADFIPLNQIAVKILTTFQPFAVG